MNRNIRRLLFYISLLIFVFVGAVLIVYAQGYKYDFNNFNFIKTGSLQLKVNVGAKVYLNDKLSGETSYFSNAITESRLLPKYYSVKIQNDNFRVWIKNAEIKAGLVTDFPRVVLVPLIFSEDFIASSSFANISSISFDKKNNSVIIRSGLKTESINLDSGKVSPVIRTPVPLIKSLPTPAPAISPMPSFVPPASAGYLSPDKLKKAWVSRHEIYIEWLENTAYQPFMKAGDILPIVNYDDDDIVDAQWYKDSDHLIINKNDQLIFTEIDMRGGQNSYDIRKISSPFYYSESADGIYFVEDRKVLRINFGLK